MYVSRTPLVVIFVCCVVVLIGVAITKGRCQVEMINSTAEQIQLLHKVDAQVMRATKAEIEADEIVLEMLARCQAGE